jgi:hypothetical protein
MDCENSLTNLDSGFWILVLVCVYDRSKVLVRSLWILSGKDIISNEQFLKPSIFSACVVLFSTFGMLFSEMFIVELLPSEQRAILIRLHLKCKDLESAAQLAKADFEAGRYHLVSFGMPGERSVLIADILRLEYNIEVIFAGCITFDKINWYTIEMSHLLIKKHGNFYEKAVAKAGEQMRAKRP